SNGPESSSATYLDGEPSVDHHDLSRYVRGFLGGEEAGQGGDFLGPAEAAECHGLEAGRLDIVAQGVGHVGLDEAGGDHVDGDAPGTDLLGDGLGAPDEARLGGGVV